MPSIRCEVTVSMIVLIVDIFMQENFPSPILLPGESYFSKATWKFTVS